jgi:hypothetical protein
VMAVFGLAAGCWDIRSVKSEGGSKGKRTRGLEAGSALRADPAQDNG